MRRIFYYEHFSAELETYSIAIDHYLSHLMNNYFRIRKKYVSDTAYCEIYAIIKRWRRINVTEGHLKKSFI